MTYRSRTFGFVFAAIMIAAMPCCTIDQGPSKPGSGYRIVGTFTDGNEGGWKLVDTNGDGVPDLTLSPDGKWYEINSPDEIQAHGRLPKASS